MLPIFDEYIKFLNDKTTIPITLQEGYFWTDNRIIKAFDKDGKCHKLFRLKINDDLSIEAVIPKNGYSDINKINLASWSDLIELNKEHLKDIEEKSLNLIKEKLNKFNDYTPIIPVSMGKDSMVVSYLVRSISPNVKAIFNNTSLDCADTYKMAKAFDNCEIMSPKEGFYEHIRRKKVIPTRFSRFCCDKFKSGVMIKKLNKKEKYLFFMGMRNDESAKRSQQKDEWTNPEWGKTNWQGILPIRRWTEMDIWLYTLWKRLEIHSKYKKGYTRCGCHIACPFYTKSTWTLDEYWFPKDFQRWRKILKEDFVGEGRWNALNCTLDEYYLYWNGGLVRDNPTDEVINEFMKYKDIKDINIAKKYFNNKCCKCGKKVKKDEVALSLKYFGRNNENMLCWECLGKELNKSKDELREDVEKFKNQGCTLF